MWVLFPFFFNFFLIYVQLSMYHWIYEYRRACVWGHGFLPDSVHHESFFSPYFLFFPPNFLFMFCCHLICQYHCSCICVWWGCCMCDWTVLMFNVCCSFFFLGGGYMKITCYPIELANELSLLLHGFSLIQNCHSWFQSENYIDQKEAMFIIYITVLNRREYILVMAFESLQNNR